MLNKIKKHKPMLVRQRRVSLRRRCVNRQQHIKVSAAAGSHHVLLMSPESYGI